MARRILLALIPLVVLIAGAPVGRAQSTLDVDVVAQPIWHTPGDELGISIRLTNDGTDPVSGYVVTVAAHSRILSRSALHESFDDPTTFEASLITAIEAPEEEIAPGDVVVREIDQPVADLQSLAVSTESGVYPLTISVFDGAGALLGTTTSQLIYYPSPPEFRLPTVPVVPIAALPHRDPNGTFEAAADGTFPLEEALARGGWLSEFITALDGATTPPDPPDPRGTRGRGGRRPAPAPAPAEPLNAALVPMPRLLEELADMADGYRRGRDDERAGPTAPASIQARTLLETIERISARSSVQPVLSPYSFPDLPTLFEFFEPPSRIPSSHLLDHLREAETVLTETMGEAPPRGWIYSTGARLNLASLEELQRLEAARFTFFSDESLEPLEDPAGGGCTEATLSFTCPVTVETIVGRSTGYVFDKDLQQRVGEVARGDGGRAALQRFFAETAMIREEVPSRTDRVIAIGLPGLWEPPAWTTRLIFQGLRDAPWLQTYTPRAGLGVLRDKLSPAERRIRPAVPRLENLPDSDYVDEIEDADEVVEALSGVQPPASLVQRLSRNILVGESRLWGNEESLLPEGQRYASDAATEADRELGKISIGGNDEIALTSRQAQIPIVVFNDASYDVSVNVRITSANLELDESFPITVQARELRQLTVDVAAQSSGIFTVTAIVETPEGREIDSKAIQVRSTEFNEIALGLTFGALAFLVLFYITRFLRGRRAEPGTKE